MGVAAVKIPINGYSGAVTYVSTAVWNARLALVSAYLQQSTFVLPIWALYSTNILGFSPTLSVMIYVGSFALGGLLEIPTGVLADRWDRRRSFIIGMSLSLVFPLAYLINPPLWIFFIAAGLSGLGYALSSGVLIPIVHYSYTASGKNDKEFNRFISHNSVALFIARATSGVTGAWLYTINPRLPFIGWAVVLLGNMGIGCLLKVGRDNQQERTPSFGSHLKKTITMMRSLPIVLLSLCTFMVVNLMADNIWTGYQFFYNDDHRSTVTVGILFSTIAVLSAIGAHFTPKLYPVFHPLTIYLATSAAMVGTAYLLFQPNLSLRLAAVVPLALVSGTYWTMGNAILCKEIPNAHQSTALSIYSLATTVTYAIGSLIVSQLIDTVGIAATRLINLVLTVSIFCLLAVLTLTIIPRLPYRLENSASPTDS